MPPRKARNKNSARGATRYETKKQHIVEIEHSEEETSSDDKEQLSEEQDLEISVMNAFEYYFAVLEQNVTWNYFIQLLILLFLTNLAYLAFGDSEDVKVQETLFNAALILIGVFIEVLVTLNGTWKMYAKDLKLPENERVGYGRPELLDFNYIYCVYLPVAIALLKAPATLPLVAASVSQLSNMQPAVKMLVATVLEFNTLPVDTKLQLREIAAIPLFFSGVYYLLNKYTMKSFTEAEKNLISTLFIILTFAVDYSTNITIQILQKLVFAFGLGAFLNLPLVEVYNKQEQSATKYILAGVIHTVFVGVGYFLSNKLLTPILDMEPLEYLSKFITATDERFEIFKYWMIASAVVIPTVLIIARWLPLDVRRKSWHYAIFAALAYPLVVDPELVSLALVGLLGIFLLVELQRATLLKPFGEIFAALLRPFQDKRDSSGAVVVSYIFLVLGVALPFWFNGAAGSKESCIGLVTLGLGDSSASLVGKRLGYHKWFNGSQKTIEGSIAFMGATAAGLYGFRAYGQNDYSDTVILMTAGLTAVVEGVTDMNDNVLIPLFGCITLNLLERF